MAIPAYSALLAVNTCGMKSFAGGPRTEHAAALISIFLSYDLLDGLAFVYEAIFFV